MADFDTSKWEAVSPDTGFDDSKWEVVKPKKVPSLAEALGGDAKQFIEKTTDSPALGRIIGAGVESALQDPSTPGINAMTGTILQADAELGRKTEELTKSRLGEEGSRLVGTGVAAAALPLPGMEAATRVAYGMASQAGQDIVGKFTKNPYVKEAAGFVAPFIAGAAGRAIFGVGDIAEGARDAQQEAAQKMLPEAKQSEIATATGQTPEATEASVHAPPEQAASGLVSLPSEELTKRRVAVNSAAFSPVRAMQEEYGRQYDAVLAPHMAKPVEATTTGGNIIDELKWAKENGISYSKPVRDLISDAQELSTTTLDENAQNQYLAQMGLKEKHINAMSPKAKENMVRQALEQGIVGGDADLPTVAKLRTIRSRASELVATASDAHDKAMANAIREGVEQDLEGAGVPGVKDLNANYRTFKTLFDKNFYRSLATAKDPIDAAETIFNQKDVNRLIVDNASDEQKATLRQLYGDAANENPKFVDYAKQRDALKALFPNTALSDAKSWVNLPDKEVDALKALNSSHEFSKKLDTAAIEALQQGRLPGGEGMKPYLLRLAKRRLPLYAAMAAGGATSGYASAMTALGIGALTQEVLQRGLQFALSQSSKAAEAFYMAMVKPSATVSQQILARGIAAAAIADVTGRMPESAPKPSDVVRAPAVKSGLTEIRTGKPGDSHADIESRMPSGDSERGFIDKTGKFVSRKDATDALNAIGGGDGKPLHSNDATGTAPPVPGPMALGDTPMQQFASAALSKVVPPPKQAILRDYDEAARSYRKGDIGALNPREWLNKGLSTQDLADGWRRSKLGRVEGALTQLPLPQVAQAYEMANNPKDASIARRVLSAKLSRGGWQNLPPQEKQKLAPVLRRILGGKQEEATLG